MHGVCSVGQIKARTSNAARLDLAIVAVYSVRQAAHGNLGMGLRPRSTRCTRFCAHSTLMDHMVANRRS